MLQANHIISWNRVIGKRIARRLAKTFPAIYRTRVFITVFTKGLTWTYLETYIYTQKQSSSPAHKGRLSK